MDIVLICGAYLVHPISVMSLVFWYYRRQKRSEGTLVWLPLLAMLAVSPFIAYLTVRYFYGDTLLPIGGLIEGLSYPVTIAAVIIYLKLASQVHVAWEYRLIPLLCVIIVSLSPRIGSVTTMAYCSRTDTRVAQPLIDALQTYRNEMGDYPLSLDRLVPDYIENIPLPTCRNLSTEQWYDEFNPQSFAITQCDSVHVLWYKQLSFGDAIRYNLESGVWSRYGLWLQSVCEKLP